MCLSGLSTTKLYLPTCFVLEYRPNARGRVKSYLVDRELSNNLWTYGKAIRVINKLGEVSDTLRVCNNPVIP